MRTFIILLLTSSSAFAQLTWVGNDIPPRHSFAMAYDSARSSAVVFGGAASGLQGDTWVRNNGIWESPALTTHPSARIDHAMVYDQHRKVIVLFGGSNIQTTNNETWEWDGSTWTRRTPQTSPSPRSLHAMCYDTSRRVTFMFGGSNGQTTSDDTWTWNGATWRKLSPSKQPPGLIRHSMAFDTLRGRAVLFGGEKSGGIESNEIWEFDGTRWIHTTPPSSPSARRDHVCVYDPLRFHVAMYGGRSGTSSKILQDRWAWNGSKWTLIDNSSTPSGHALHAMTYTSKGETLLFGGIRRSSQFETDTWSVKGNNWVKETPLTQPPSRNNHALSYDNLRGRVLLFGGSNPKDLGDTWEWDGKNWLAMNPAQRPPSRSFHALAFDKQRKNTVLFGGFFGSASAPFGDTWTWNGSNWKQHNPTTSPAPRTEHSMVYDSRRQRVVLFGGLTSSGAKNDTWEWNGTTWTQRFVSTKPPIRIESAMAFDESNGRTILYGGRDIQLKSLNDTWTWNGAKWSQLVLQTTPGPRFRHAMAYYPSRGRIVLFGGTGSDETTWEWTGRHWTKPATTTNPPARNGQEMAFDGDSVLMFGGFTGKPIQWQYRSQTLPVGLSVGSGCATSTSPTLWLLSLPLLGAPDFGFRIDQAPPTSIGVVGIATQPAATPLPGGCTLFMNAPWVSIPIAANGSGHGSLQFAIPQNSSLRGLNLYSQAFLTQAGGPHLGLAAFTQGVIFKIGD